MAQYLVQQTFSAAVGKAGVQTFRPGDLVDDSDPDFAKIQAAAPTYAALVNGYPGNVPADAVAMRLRAVPDDIVQDYCFTQWIAWC
jgi:hypothetical protein